MSQSTLRIQNFKIGPLEDFEKKKVQGWENHFRVAKIGFWDHFPHWLGVYLVWKSGFRFSFGAPRVPEPKDQIQRLQLQNLDQSPASKFLTKLYFQWQYHSSIKWVSLYWNENVHSIWNWGHWYWTSHLAGMQITTLNIFKLSLLSKMLPKVMFPLPMRKSVDFSINRNITF